VIGRRLNVPIVGKSSEDAAEHFGWFAHFAAIDALASSEKIRKFAELATEVAWANPKLGPFVVIRKRKQIGSMNHINTRGPHVPR
jgi:hypothetical protein